MIIYILARRLYNQTAFVNVEIVKVTRSKRVKDAWLKKPGIVFWKRSLR